MSSIAILTWVVYIALLLGLTYLAKSNDSLLPGKVSAVVQSLAYVATYISAVALVGFAGLGYNYGLQIIIIAVGNIWLGVWFVYRFLAWPTKKLQESLGAKTPIELIAKGYGSREFGRFSGLLAGLLILIYCSAVFKGGAIMLTSAVPISETQALIFAVVIVSISVLWGGLRAVLYTEALQGLIMSVGVIALVIGVLKEVGGVSLALEHVAQLPPTAAANNGFASFSSGLQGMTILSLAFVTSVGVWAQPQVIQRHFALKSKEQAIRVIPLAMLIIALLLGGAYFVGGISRLLLGNTMTSPDHVIPELVRRILPDFGRQIFALAIVSAALSTASALLHVACGTLGQDVLGKKLTGAKWYICVILGAVFSGVVAVNSTSIIALICSTSWTLIASILFVPYLALLIYGTGMPSRCAWGAGLVGLAGAMLWYAFGFETSSIALSGMAAPGLIGAIHPFFIGLMTSFLGFILAKSG